MAISILQSQMPAILAVITLGTLGAAGTSSAQTNAPTPPPDYCLPNEFTSDNFVIFDPPNSHATDLRPASMTQGRSPGRTWT